MHAPRRCTTAAMVRRGRRRASAAIQLAFDKLRSAVICQVISYQSWNPHAVTEIVPPPAFPDDVTTIAVLPALAGMHSGPRLGSVTPSPDASGAVHCVKFSVPVIVPVTVALPVAAAVALARIEKPQRYVVWPATAGNVAAVAVVVPVADAVIGVAPIG
jgi:hypothetical protein